MFRGQNSLQASNQEINISLCVIFAFPQALVGYRPLKERHVDRGQTLDKFGKQIKHGKLKKVLK